MFRFRLQPILCTIVNVVNGMVSGQRSTLGTGLSGEPRTWKGQAAGNSKTYWPSCTACKARCNHDFSANFGKKVVETRILWHFYGLIYRPVQGHSLLYLLPKTKLSSKEQQKRLWCIQLALRPDVQHKITSNRLRPYGIDYFSVGLTTNSSMSRSTWKGQAAGNSKKYWPSCTACSVIRRWCNHHFSAIFAKKVVETGILWQFYGLIYRPVQHKITSNRLRPYCIDYFSSQWFH